MGMGIEENEIVVAKIIAEESKRVRPLAIRVKEFNVRSLTKDEMEVSLEQLKRRSIVKEYRHCWGFFIKRKGKQLLAFSETDKGHYPQFDDDGGQSGDEAEVFLIEFNPAQLTKYLESKRLGTVVAKAFEKRGEDFYYNDRKIAFDTHASIHYYILDILYGDEGASRFMSYESINSELESRFNQPKVEMRDKIIERIKNALHNGLYRQGGDFLKNYVRIRPRAGVEFRNPPK